VRDGFWATAEGGWFEMESRDCRRRYQRKSNNAAIIARQPATTPPTIAPTGVEGFEAGEDGMEGAEVVLEA